MKTNSRPDKRIHIRKKVAGGTTGAILGALVGGPVAALVGGVAGTLVGNAAERGTLSKLAGAKPRAKTSARKTARNIKVRIKRSAPSRRSKTSRSKSPSAKRRR